VAKKTTKKKAADHVAAVGKQLTDGYNAYATKQAENAPPVTTVSPTVDPFLTGQDLVDLSGILSDLDQKLGFTDASGVVHKGSIDTGLEDLGSQTAIQKDQVDKSAKENTSSATDNAIARGLFQSSIKDATLIDIEAQRAIQQKFLDDRLSTATINANTQKSALGQYKTGVLSGFNTKAVENAKGIEPTVTTTPAPPPQTFTYVPPKVKPGTQVAQPTTVKAPAAKNPPISDGGSPPIGKPSPTVKAAAASFSSRRSL
jgi:hypothetical protein